MFESQRTQIEEKIKIFAPPAFTREKKTVWEVAFGSEFSTFGQGLRGVKHFFLWKGRYGVFISLIPDMFQPAFIYFMFC
jgi:hypothetical protein